MKTVLIVSPNFPPVNAADMHRIRQSLPYFKELGWEPVVLAVEEQYIEAYSSDQLLKYTIPENTEVHKVKAWNVQKTRKFGLGSLGIRSYFFLKKQGNLLLKKRHFDLVYFSTTAFHVMALGPYWKKKFAVPFVLDIQDPWRNDFYLDKPASERPPKFWFAYTIDKLLEQYTVPKASGIISVSQGYCDTFRNRYPSIREEQCKIITFAGSTIDFEVMEKYYQPAGRIQLKEDKINLVYIGRGGFDMHLAINTLFAAIQQGLQSGNTQFSKLHCWFIGTSYAPEGQGIKFIEPLAETFGLQGMVTEITDRIPYFESLYLLKKAQLLFIPGSTDTHYTASKIFPYILSEKPLLAVFHQNSSVVNILATLHYGSVLTFENNSNTTLLANTCRGLLENLLSSIPFTTPPDRQLFENYSSKNMTKAQTDFFDQCMQA